ncbi:hypothetical protein [Microbispora sp. NPDC049633]|uniref:hypothetical protein n=1 Tax=Microbispora sp. NPDC049633 TaxID=3154355 RepID=UPI00341CA501
MASVIFREETGAGRALAEFSLPGLPGRVTARELVRLRVREEVARHNASPARPSRAPLTPADAEAERTRRPDWERQADAAEAAFAHNGFLLLIGDRQIEDLDAEIDLTADPVVSFVRLVPLAGG